VPAQREALSETFSCLLRLDAGRESSNVCHLPEKEPAAMTKALLRGESDQVTLEIAALAGLTVKQLKGRWRSLYGAEPLRYISRELLTGAVAYRLQERAFGGLKPVTRRLLERVGGVHASKLPIPTRCGRQATAGTVLVREWHGISHRVSVLDNGVSYRGQRFQSLSEVARLITGSRWSGPRFFGLNRRSKETGNG
jgi:hypothetical protein